LDDPNTGLPLRHLPPTGETREVAPGVHWIRMPLPFALNHINLWLIEDGEGVVIVDTGYGLEGTRTPGTPSSPASAGR
jgi:glyoxylase-like metal-dependent hydrolase (beta-lactamase superfamily II)